MLVFSSRAALSALVKSSLQPAWRAAIDYADALGLSLSTEISSMRDNLDPLEQVEREVEHVPILSSIPLEPPATSTRLKRKRARVSIEDSDHNEAKASAKHVKKKCRVTSKAISDYESEFEDSSHENEAHKMPSRDRSPEMRPVNVRGGPKRGIGVGLERASSPSMIQYIDKSCNRYNGYRLGSSPETAIPITSGIAHLDPETGRLMIAPAATSKITTPTQPHKRSQTKENEAGPVDSNGDWEVQVLLLLPL